MHPSLDFFGLHISSYFFVISLATIVSSLWFIRRSERHSLHRVTAIDLTLVTLAGGLVGARLLHVIWEAPDTYLADPMAVLKIWNGGFVYLGGVLGGAVAASLFCRWRSEPFWLWADQAAPTLALGYAIGRMACFLNGCCYGRVCELPWAVRMGDGLLRHPTQLYATLWELVLMNLLLWLERRRSNWPVGFLFNAWLFGHALGRLVMEIYRDDDRGGFVLNLSLGSWMSLVFGLFAAYNLVSVLQTFKSEKT